MPIKRKLPLFIVLLVAIPIFLFVAIYYPYVSGQMVQANKEKIQQVLDLESEYLTSFFEMRQLEAQYLATSQEVNQWTELDGQNDKIKLNQFFEQERMNNEELRDIFIIGSSGKVVASSNPDSIGLDLWDREYFQTAMLGETVFSSLLQDRIEGESVLFVATPIRDQEKTIVGVMANIINMNYVSTNMVQLVAPEVGTAYLIDQDGQVIFHTDRQRIGNKHKNPSINDYFTQLRPITYNGTQVIMTNGAEKFLAHGQIEGTEWILVIEQDMDMVMLSARKAFIVILVLSILLLSITAILGYAFARRIVSPLSELIHVMNSTSNGELNVRIQYEGKDEFGQLASQFNSMLDELVGAYEEISEKNGELILIEDELRHLAFNDQLTELPNRMAMFIELEERIQSHRKQEKELAIVLIDIDQFKRINDTLGHAAGDQVLVEVTNRLIQLEWLTYRLSGDEFAVIIVDEENLKNIQETIDVIQKVLSEPIELTDKRISISVSMGISVFPDNGDTPEKLVQSADTAMDIAKQTGKAQVAFFSQVMMDTVLRKVKIEQILKRSIKDGLLDMHFQPKYDVQSRQLMGFEALMRLTLENGERISPAEFIPIAEESGFIIELGEWALEFVFAKIDYWMKKGYSVGHVGVNVSGMQLKQEGFAEHAKAIAAAYHVPPNYVELEITESILIGNMSETLQTLLELRKIGYQIALDDFGTGYSAFNYLRTIPLTALKIDKTFIDHMGTHQKAEMLVKQIIDIAHEINLNVVAEGVETKIQYQSLLNTRCDMIQGYYFSKPMSTNQIEELLKKNED
jgi:diguanylate cyclase (GGDEF)-like protein